MARAMFNSISVAASRLKHIEENLNYIEPVGGVYKRIL
jgi:hypothetical protein